MKKFYEKWSSEEIDKYLEKHPVLVLFKIHISLGEAEVILHGRLNEKQKILLQVCIASEFGNLQMSEELCLVMNEFAEQWYDKFVKSKKIRVLNFGKRGR